MVGLIKKILGCVIAQPNINYFIFKVLIIKKSLKPLLKTMEISCTEIIKNNILMKNFTNNFKQFTSRLSARWLIMALMLLLGTSSAWAATVYYVNKSNCSTIKIHFWGGSPNTSWESNPSMEPTDDYVKDGDNKYRVYKYDVGTNNSCIFRCDNGQTSDLTVNDGKYYYDGNWKSKSELSFVEYFPAGTVLYLKPNSNWTQSDAYFALYLFTGDTNTWVRAEAVCNNDGYYQATVPEGIWETIIWCRMNPNGTNTDNNYLNWDNKWNQTGDLTYDSSYDLFTVSYTNDWNGATTTWSKWTTKQPCCTKVTKPTISITNPTKCGDEPVTAGKVTITNYNPEYNYTLKKGGTVEDIVYSDGYAITEAGSYTVTADLKSGTSCGDVTSESQTASIEDKTPSIGDFEITGVTEICSGTSTNLECTDVNGDTYLWNTGATTRSINTGNLIEDTNYSVTVTKLNGTCPATKTANITIIVNALPSAPALNVPEGKVCAGDLILDDYIADSEINTVNWYKNSGCTEPATNPNLEPSVEETFYAKSKDGNNCISSGYSELTLTSYALPSDFIVTVSDDEVCSGEDVTINIEGRENGVDYKLENEVIPAEGITVNPTKNTTYSVIASLSECQNMTNTKESQQITVNGTTITQSPEVVHPYEVVTFTAGEQAKWALYTNPSSGSQLSDDDAKYSGKDTAYITKGESTTTTFKGEAASGYVIHATVGDCTASYTFNVVEDPNNCQ